MNNLNIVLVEPLYSGNIGSSARAITNFGFDKLTLVNPRCEIDKFARQMAAGAQKTLKNAKIVNSINEAIKDSTLVCACTSMERPRHPVKSINHAIKDIIRHEKVSILFGREDKGLKNEEMYHASIMINVPTNPEYASLNLAVSVAITCYEIHRHLHLFKNEKKLRVANRNEYQAFYSILQKLLLEHNYCHEKELTKKMIRIRRIFDKYELDKREIQILLGIFKNLGE